MRIFTLLICLVFLTTLSRAQDFSNKGKEFWLGYGNHQQMYSSQHPGMDVYVASDVDTEVTLDIPGLGITETYEIFANQVRRIGISNQAFLNQEGLSNKGIHITALKPVVVYAHIFFSAVSGASLCLPVATLGREYYSVNFRQEAQWDVNSTSYSWFFVVATEDNTEIEVTPSANTQTMTAGETYTQVLQKGQVFNVLASTDLTGSTIRSVNNGSGCKRIAVFCGSGRIGIGCASGGVNSSDNLFQQLYPTSTWGKKYITVPSSTRPLNYYRVIRPDPAAVVKRDGVVVPATDFTDNLYYEFSDASPHIIESDKPILVAQYFTTQDCAERTDNGDPEMIYLSPVEQTINRVTVASMRLINPSNNVHFINAVVKNHPGAINSFMIDGVGYAGSFVPHPADPAYAYAQIEVDGPVAHTITCDTPFNAIAYGFGRTESYGYSAGSNLKDLYQYVSLQNEYAVVHFPAGCKNTPFRLAMTFPYQPTEIQWIFGPALNAMGVADVHLNTPVADSSWAVDGRTLYRYRLPGLYTVGTPGTYSIVVKANNPTGDGCNGEQTIEYDLEIFERPKADYSFAAKCLGDPVVFTDRTNGQGRSVVKWFWALDDGNTSAVKDVTHTYAAAGMYEVAHWGITDIGCLSDTITKTVELASLPDAAFTLSPVHCQDTVITLTDQSTLTGGTLARWTWDFGDHTGATATTNAPQQHVYNSPGNYTIGLVVESSKGCVSAPVSQLVVIHPAPVPHFTTPEVCLLDAVRFTSTSTIADNSEAQFGYYWDFGNGNSSTLASPQHTYGAAGDYQVSLAVTSKDGCTQSVTQPLTVNGDVRRGAFVVQEPGALCENKAVVIEDRSEVVWGKLVRVEIYWDYTNDPTVKTVDEDPVAGKSYTHKYPDFGSPATRAYQVRYVAYSGENCFETDVQTLTIKASPVVEFGALQPVCEEVAPFAITSTRETFGLSGTGMVTGPGMGGDGLTFSPRAATPGLHTLRYAFTAGNGCTAFSEQTIRVYPSPVVNAGPDKGVLEGGFVVLDGRATGTGLQFGWTPVGGIDHPGIPTPRVSPTEDVTYTLTVVSGDGCRGSDEVFVRVLKQLIVPNTFTPNGDGINDTWKILYLESYPGCTVEVYNRFGQRIFSSVGYDREWDGTLNGNALPVGTYYWIINPKNGRQQLHGSVTIIR